MSVPTLPVTFGSPKQSKKSSYKTMIFYYVTTYNNVECIVAIIPLHMLAHDE